MAESVTIHVGDSVGDVSAILLRPADARALLVFAHGAGAGMRHAFMEQMSARLAERGIATLRYQFPYFESGRKRPDPPGILLATVRAAVERGAEIAAHGRAGAATGDRDALPLFAGGKSMGGRMTSQAAAKWGGAGGAAGKGAAEGPGAAVGKGAVEGAGAALARVRGLVFFGFPLHAAGKPSSERAAHLVDVKPPMLFLQGTRDSLADLDLLRPVCDDLGERATLHPIDGADHGFHVRKSSGRTDGELLDELARVTAEWIEGC